MNVKGCAGLLMTQKAKHNTLKLTHMHTPPLTCRNEHFATRSEPGTLTNTPVIKAAVSFPFLPLFFFTLFPFRSFQILLLENWLAVRGVGETVSKQHASCELLLNLYKMVREAGPNFTVQAAGI